jgi:hypothetical protein
MTDEQIAYSISKMKEYGIVDSGDAQKLGIGAMTDARMKSFFDKMVKAGCSRRTWITEELHPAVREQGGWARHQAEAVALAAPPPQPSS